MTKAQETLMAKIRKDLASVQSEDYLKKIYEKRKKHYPNSTFETWLLSYEGNTWKDLHEMACKENAIYCGEGYKLQTLKKLSEIGKIRLVDCGFTYKIILIA